MSAKGSLQGMAGFDEEELDRSDTEGVRSDGRSNQLLRKRLETLVSRIDILRERMTIQKQVLHQLSL